MSERVAGTRSPRLAFLAIPASLASRSSVMPRSRSMMTTQMSTKGKNLNRPYLSSVSIPPRILSCSE
ncbi:MAG TPA: hypothetical protein PLX54_01680 [Candidatus Fermentibacter daniensis]|nr:MAG: hypothetical protein AO394_07970 [Candidatus Fermentibacter daniensis]KZD15985.1 MAG: hypothetical protein AO395_05180 [Candidatus Fermentibacter daniensis]KZD19710.1 MAG: hypothetical protein AO396_08465 [Candidatus Fermentibacter daniensis]HOA04646.1 hypothetical protein [Candidatus Fermentibacter daniensis]HOD18901.1 hypothetical protein [Candidatus Fermentibacter daniensis]